MDPAWARELRAALCALDPVATRGACVAALSVIEDMAYTLPLSLGYEPYSVETTERDRAHEETVCDAMTLLFRLVESVVVTAGREASGTSASPTAQLGGSALVVHAKPRRAGTRVGVPVSKHTGSEHLHGTLGS